MSAYTMPVPTAATLTKCSTCAYSGSCQQKEGYLTTMRKIRQLREANKRKRVEATIKIDCPIYRNAIEDLRFQECRHRSEL